MLSLSYLLDYIIPLRDITASLMKTPNPPPKSKNSNSHHNSKITILQRIPPANVSLRTLRAAFIQMPSLTRTREEPEADPGKSYLIYWLTYVRVHLPCRQVREKMLEPGPRRVHWRCNTNDSGPEEGIMAIHTNLGCPRADMRRYTLLVPASP